MVRAVSAVAFAVVAFNAASSLASRFDGFDQDLAIRDFDEDSLEVRSVFDGEDFEERDYDDFEERDYDDFEDVFERSPATPTSTSVAPKATATPSSPTVSTPKTRTLVRTIAAPVCLLPNGRLRKMTRSERLDANARATKRADRRARRIAHKRKLRAARKHRNARLNGEPAPASPTASSSSSAKASPTPTIHPGWKNHAKNGGADAAKASPSPSPTPTVHPKWKALGKDGLAQGAKASPSPTPSANAKGAKTGSSAVSTSSQPKIHSAWRQYDNTPLARGSKVYKEVKRTGKDGVTTTYRLVTEAPQACVKSSSRRHRRRFPRAFEEFEDFEERSYSYDELD
jgi:hypothetical protein